MTRKPLPFATASLSLVFVPHKSQSSNHALFLGLASFRPNWIQLTQR